MNGINVVLKNQYGNLKLNILSFNCHVCGKTKTVNINCVRSTKAFNIIRNNPHTQLICFDCDMDIYILNMVNFTGIDFEKQEAEWYKSGEIIKCGMKKPKY